MENLNQSESFRRAALPEVMFAVDAALALQVPAPIAAINMVSGAFGPAFTVDGRPAVLREEFLAALARRASVRTESREEVIRDR
ncbi:MAG: hypothetical protein IT459_23560 [Planctomycetes bacterium]|nr:hypothetical protein [Planctomycetota bacterium]